MRILGYIIIGGSLVLSYSHISDVIAKLKMEEKALTEIHRLNRDINYNIAYCTWMLMWFGVGIILVLVG